MENPLLYGLRGESINRNKIEYRHGWWIPSYDLHYQSHLSNQKHDWIYQGEQREFALGHVTNYEIAIDVGGNVGFWARDLCNVFDEVLIFEPMDAHVECLRRNLEDYRNWHVEQVALSEKESEQATFYFSQDESGNAGLSLLGVMNANSQRKLQESQVNKESVKVKKLDSYLYLIGSRRVGFLKVDCQGHEYEILKGARKLLVTHKPTLCLELPNRNWKEFIYLLKVKWFLRRLGFHYVGRVIKDRVFTSK